MENVRNEFREFCYFLGVLDKEVVEFDALNFLHVCVCLFDVSWIGWLPMVA